MQPAKCPLKCGKIVQEWYNMIAHIKACIKKHLAVSFNCFIVVFICIWTFFLVVTAEEEKMIFWWKYWYIHVPTCNFQKNLQCDKCSFCISSEQVDTFMEHFSRTMQCLQVWRIYCLWCFFFQWQYQQIVSFWCILCSGYWCIIDYVFQPDEAVLVIEHDEVTNASKVMENSMPQVNFDFC